MASGCGAGYLLVGLGMMFRWILSVLIGASISVLAATAAGRAADPPRVGPAWDDPANPIAVLFKGERLDLWSLRPLDPGAVPEVADAAWPRGEIDRYVLALLEAAGLRPAPSADRRALARRLSFDLTGLPPLPDEVEAFLADTSPDAVERLVDRLLASPAFGEHWARLWLDVARYSDSNGFDWDEFRPQAWRFRDYVIRSFNADKPFDRFVIEQLAGDELLAGAPRDEAGRDALIATGFLRIGPQDNSASLFNEQDRARHELLTDLTETTGAAFLAVTLACCRCHDHKTEPLSQADHFRFRAFFETVAPADDLPIDLAARQEEIREAHARIDAVTQPLEKERARLLRAAKERLAAEGKKDPSDKDARAAFSSEEKEAWEATGRDIDAARTGRPEFTKGLLMTDAADAGERPAESRVLAGGDHRRPGEAVPAGFLSILDPGPATIEQPPNLHTNGRRLALARWLTDPRNPLTARVYVNRLWQSLFGLGLVATPNDFGHSGEKPSHPELLDWLALRFMEDGWSTKRMLRTMVLSATYQQASAHPDATARDAVARDAVARDAAPGLWAGRSLRRLSAEQMRDAQLAVSGLLRPLEGGPPVWPELPREVLTANPAFLDDNETRTKGWYPSPPEARPARSIYLVQKRTVRVPLMETFDLPENATSCGRRTVSTVAPQALALLNGSLTEEVADALARRIAEAAGDDPGARVAAGFRLALQRLPAAGEHERALRFLEAHSLEELARVLINLNEFVYVD